MRVQHPKHALDLVLMQLGECLHVEPPHLLHLVDVMGVACGGWQRSLHMLRKELLTAHDKSMPSDTFVDGDNDVHQCVCHTQYHEHPLPENVAELANDEPRVCHIRLDQLPLLRDGHYDAHHC